MRSQAAGRTEANLNDVAFALDEVGVSPAVLHEYKAAMGSIQFPQVVLSFSGAHGARSRLPIPFRSMHTVVSGYSVAVVLWCLQDIPPFPIYKRVLFCHPANPTSSTTIPATAPTRSAVAVDGHSSLPLGCSHIPEFLPSFPDEHTYRRTPVVRAIASASSSSSSSSSSASSTSSSSKKRPVSAAYESSSSEGSGTLGVSLVELDRAHRQRLANGNRAAVATPLESLRSLRNVPSAVDTIASTPVGRG